jgi:hypothetical protein
MANPPKLDAVDVLNWDYLVEIGEYIEGDSHRPEIAIKGFAYAFTSTASEEHRNQILEDIIRNSTARSPRKKPNNFSLGLPGT